MIIFWKYDGLKDPFLKIDRFHKTYQTYDNETPGRIYLMKQIVFTCAGTLINDIP